MKALAVATGIVFWTLVLGIAWLAFFPGGDTGEPVAILQIEPAVAPAGPATAEEPQGAPAPETGESSAPPGPQAPAEASRGNSMDVPPGFVVGPPGAPPAPMVEPPGQQGQGTTMMPIAPGVGSPAEPAPAPDDAAPPEDPDQQGEAPPAQPPTQQTALATPPAQPTGPATTPPPPTIHETETGSIVLPPVPVAELVEESQYGPLPKVATDGRRPIDVYARPSRYAAANAGGPPRVAILVTGLGEATIGDPLKGLPPTVSVAYSAYGRSLQDAVNSARNGGHEVLLQIPLEPNNYPAEDPGPHTLLTTLPPEENMKRLQWLMSRYTGYVGITNLMGSKFVTSAGSFQPVLEEVKRRGLLYVDDGGTQGSTAWQIANTIGLDYSVASVQIDAGDVAKQLAKLEATAKERGAAIGVAKAKPATIKQISDWANKLEGKGIVLVPVSAAVRSQRQS